MGYQLKLSSNHTSPDFIMTTFIFYDERAIREGRVVQKSWYIETGTGIKSKISIDTESHFPPTSVHHTKSLPRATKPAVLRKSPDVMEPKWAPQNDVCLPYT